MLEPLREPQTGCGEPGTGRFACSASVGMIQATGTIEQPTRALQLQCPASRVEGDGSSSRQYRVVPSAKMKQLISGVACLALCVASAAPLAAQDAAPTAPRSTSSHCASCHDGGAARAPTASVPGDVAAARAGRARDRPDDLDGHRPLGRGAAGDCGVRDRHSVRGRLEHEAVGAGDVRGHDR